MYKFAHLADCHLGSQKEPELKKLELKAFEECMNKCLEEKVDFIIIAGDLFHSNLPDLSIVKEALKKLREVHEKGIPIYVDYGSHDFSPNDTSIIDLITETGFMKKLFIPEVIEDDEGNVKLKLEFLIDEKTNAKLVGISGRKLGIDQYFYEILDRESLEKEEGFKIFVFHNGIEGMLPSFLSKMDVIKRSLLPKGFDYYAGGHIHKMRKENPDEYGPIVFPGPLFAGYPRDLELSADGDKKGFFIVEFDDKIEKCHFTELNIAEYKKIPIFSADYKSSIQLYDEIKDKVNKCDVNGKIVIMKVKGQLSGGKTSDINFNEIKKILKENGAIYVNINRHSLTSKEFSKVTYKGESSEEIEENLLKDNIINIDVETKNLMGNKGAKLANNLINIIRQNPKSNEKKMDYNNRILKDALRILNLEGIMDDI